MFHSKYKIILAAIFGVVLTLSITYLAIFGRALGQPENHLSIALALPKAMITAKAIPINDATYLAPSAHSFIETMREKGFAFTEQMGSTFFFTKDGERYHASSRMYSSYFALFSYPVAERMSYKNEAYGFSITLPTSWTGYSIVTSTWDGYTSDNERGDVTIAHGPLIAIRNPQWTSAKPYQDIPIMVFTLHQWNSLQQEQFHIGAAPIEPSELGRNARYVFALPARYNYAFPLGYEEVDRVLQSKPLKTF